MAGYIGSKASVVSSGAEHKKTFTITGATTSLTGLNYTVGKVHVFQNGVRLVDGTDYTATNGTTITLTVAAQSGDNVVVISQASFQLSESYTSTEADAEFVTKTGDTMTGALTTTGLTVDGNLTLSTNTAYTSANSIRNNSNALIFSGGTSGYFFNRHNNSATDLSIDSLGNVGIGTDSPAQKLTVASEGRLRLNRADNTRYGDIYVNNDSLNIETSNDPIKLSSISYTKFDVSGAERMRIDSSGNLHIGRTSTGAVGNGHTIRGGDSAVFSRDAAGETVQVCRRNDQGDLIQFRRGGGVCGEIVNTGSSSVAYNTSSDYRLKENVVDLIGASARVNQLDVKRFNFIADGTDTVVDGFLAHEVADVVPEAVTGAKDAMRDEEYEVTPAVEATYDEDGNELTAAVEAVMGTRSVPDYQGIDQSKLVPLLTAALQEALTEIASLKTRVEALEA